VTLNAGELLFIESADNYATLVSIVNGKKKKELIRSSLKRIEGQLNHPDLMRCHRAYIINLGKIKTVEEMPRATSFILTRPRTLFRYRATMYPTQRKAKTKELIAACPCLCYSS